MDMSPHAFSTPLVLESHLVFVWPISQARAAE
jgi:hypothetical protein